MDWNEDSEEEKRKYDSKMPTGTWRVKDYEIHIRDIRNPDPPSLRGRRK